MEKVIDRFAKYMNWAGLNDNKVTVAAGLSNGILGKAKNSAHDLSAPNISKLLYVYKDIDARWLMTGEGEMLLKESEKHSSDGDLSRLLTMFNEKDKYCSELLEINKTLEKTIFELQYQLRDNISSNRAG